MHLCYIDESGNGQTLDPAVPHAPPVPLACHTYASDLTWNVHCDGSYESLRQRIGERLRKLQFRWRDPVGKWKGGIVVSDRRFGRSGGTMLQPAPTTVPIPSPAGPVSLPRSEDARPTR